MQKFALPLRHFCHLLYKFRRPSGFQNARDSCEYLYFSKDHFVYRWYSPVFSNVSNTTITWTAFWQLIDKDTTWNFQRLISFSHINCPMSMLSVIATQKYMSKNLSLPTWKFIREGCSKEVRLLFTTQTYSEAQNQFFPLPQHPKNNSNLRIEKLPVSPTSYRKLTFFGTYLPLSWAIPFFSKHLMTFNTPNLTIYLPWSS